MTSPAPFPVRFANPRQRFLNAVREIAGNTARILLCADGGDATAIRDESGLGHTFTQSGTVVGRLTRQGQGWLWSYLTASSQYADTPDAADLSFGTGAADLPCSFVALLNVTDSAAQRAILTKWGSGTDEYAFVVDATDHLALQLRDSSANVAAVRTSDAAITQGSLTLFGASYAGTGGATAANGITLYQAGVLIASTAANNAGYVAMENLGSPVELGSIVGHITQFFGGQVGFVLLCAANLSAAQHAALAEACRRYYGAALP